MKRSDRLLRASTPLLFLTGMVLFADGSSAQQVLPTCHLIAAGGTIAMKIDPVKNAPVPALSGEDLVATVPELAKSHGSRWRTRSMFLQITWTPSAGR